MREEEDKKKKRRTTKRERGKKDRPVEIEDTNIKQESNKERHVREREK